MYLFLTILWNYKIGQVNIWLLFYHLNWAYNVNFNLCAEMSCDDDKTIVTLQKDETQIYHLPSVCIRRRTWSRPLQLFIKTYSDDLKIAYLSVLRGRLFFWFLRPKDLKESPHLKTDIWMVPEYKQQPVLSGVRPYFDNLKYSKRRSRPLFDDA